MNKTYIYALLKSTWSNIVNREELLQMLNTQDLTSATRSIINKPIGTVLYEVVSKKTFSLNELDYRLTSFNNERIMSIYSKISGKEKKLIDNLNTIFDTINLYYIALFIQNGKRASVIYPIGRLSNIELSNINNFDSLRNIIPIDLVKTLDLILSTNIVDLTNLITIFSNLKPITEDLSVKRVLSFIRDSVLIKTCLLIKQLPATGLSVLTMYLSDFENICNLRDLKTLPQILHSLNPLYAGFSELLNDIFSIKCSFELLDLAIILYSLNISSDLINNLERVVLRTYLLYLSEAMIIRMILSLIDSNMYIDRFRDIVSKWWPL
ncbi:MAG: hypothetical protein QXP71_05805 [Desulfurococcaceae archaeon]